LAIRILAALLLGAAAVAPAAALSERAVEQRLVRLEFDNDVFLGTDDGFTAGWSLQLHSAILDRWDEDLPAWIGKLPGLGDDGEGGRAVRWAAGLSQIMVSPRDVEEPGPQPEDFPWAGSLGLHGTLVSLDDLRMVAVQLYLGCLGPCSRAEEVQRFIHEDLGWGKPLAGWDHQIERRWLANLNLAGGYKLWASPVSRYRPGRFAADLSVGGQVALGNLATFAQAQLELRFGRGVPRGFAHVPDPPGIGVAADPVYVDRGARATPPPRSWFRYASVVVRASHFEQLAFAEGGRTRSGGWHPGIELDLDEPVLVVGLHAGRAPIGFHATYYRYPAGRQRAGLGSSLDWVNLSLDLRF